MTKSKKHTNNLITKDKGLQDAYFEGYAFGCYSDENYKNPNDADTPVYNAFWEGFLDGRKEYTVKKSIYETKTSQKSNLEYLTLENYYENIDD